MAWKRHATAYLFLLPALAIFIVFVFQPMVQVFRYSFSRFDLLQPGGWIGLENYRRLLQDADFWTTFRNAWIYLLVTPTLIVCSLGLALLVRGQGKIRHFFRAAYYIPVVTPVVVVGIAWKWLLNEDRGLVNYLLTATGLTSPAAMVHWLTQYPLNLFSVMGVTLWQGLGYYMVIFLAGLLAIPPELEEAAAIDGANALQRTLYVTLPLLKPSMVLVFIISSIAALKVFTEIYIMIGGAPMSNKTLVVYIYEKAFSHLEMGYASALSVVLFLATLAFSYANLRVMESRVVS